MGRRRWQWCARLTAVLLCAAGPGVAGVGDGLAVVIADARTEAVLASFPARTGDAIYLAYTHSIYRVPMVERYSVSAAGFRLQAVQPGSTAAAQFYGFIDGRDGSFNIGAVFHSLLLGVGTQGDYRLSLDGRRFDRITALADPTARRVILTVATVRHTR